MLLFSEINSFMSNSSSASLLLSAAKRVILVNGERILSFIYELSRSQSMLNATKQKNESTTRTSWIKICACLLEPVMTNSFCSSR